MEAKINIAEILKDKPVELKLYSSTFGYIKFNCVYKNKVYFSSEDTNVHSVKSNGKMYDGGECIIFPSKEMRNWNKFAWKKGDVLMSDNGKVEVIFEKFVDDTYQSFIGKHHLDNLEDNLYYQNEGEYLTSIFNIESEDAAQTYVKTLEKKLDGKLNRETLEIEKTQPEFKDGDIVTIINGCEQRCILIFRNIIGDSLNRYCILTKRGLFTEGYSLIDKEDSLLFATEEEKNKLFSALEKEGKAWDSEKKKVVNLKPKCEFNPFDKVVVRCSEADRWSIDFFSHKVSNGYICAGDAWFGYCLPYNEETAKLLGTRNNMEDQT